MVFKKVNIVGTTVAKKSGQVSDATGCLPFAAGTTNSCGREGGYEKG
jgi:hypothetical protein